MATYGLLVAAGYLAGIAWLSAQRRNMELSEERFWNLIYVLFFGAIVGGKLLYWAVSWRDILNGDLRLIRDIRFGFVYFGGLLGVFAAGVWYKRRHNLVFMKIADYFSTALPVGHAIGRLGCFMAGCCAGRPTEMPWGVRFTHPASLVHHALRGTPLHPTQLYEAGANILIAVLLYRLLGRVRTGRLAQGTVFVTYLALYSVARFVIEFFRGDDRGGELLALSPSQWIALGTVAAAAYLYKFHRGRSGA